MQQAALDAPDLQLAEQGAVELEQAGEGNLAGKILWDLANPLDFSRGMPPSLSVSNTPVRVVGFPLSRAAAIRHVPHTVVRIENGAARSKAANQL